MDQYEQEIAESWNEDYKIWNDRIEEYRCYKTLFECMQDVKKLAKETAGMDGCRHSRGRSRGISRHRSALMPGYLHG